MKWKEQADIANIELQSIPFPLDPCTISGGRSSGKTTLLQEVCAQKETTNHCLVIIPWPEERESWYEKIKKEKLKNIIIHTPDSLARHLITIWSKHKKKEIHWIIDKDEKPEKWIHTETSYAKKLLQQGKMTAGVAHWLLEQEIEEFLKKGLLPRKIQSLLLDEIDIWEPEASYWTRKIPTEKTWETTKAPVGEIHLTGTIKNSQRIKEQFIEIEFNNSGNGEWLCSKLNKAKAPIAIVIQENNKIAWYKYISCRCSTPITILHATELEGKKFHTILIPNLNKNWGSAKTARDWLDLIASKSITCLAKIDPQNPPHWIPISKPEREKKFLSWCP